MGFISELAKTKNDFPNLSHDRDRSRSLWREVFGGVSKDEGLTNCTPARPDSRGGSYSRSITSDASYARLLKAMQTAAPGGWTDDRYQETAHYTGPVYTGIARPALQLMKAEFMVFKKDPSVPDGKRAVQPDDPPEGDRKCRPYDLVKLLQRPNPKEWFGQLCYRMYQQLHLTGSALNWMVPNVFEVPFQLYNLPTAICVPQAVVSADYPHGYYRIMPIYPYGPFSTWPTPQTSVGAPVPAQWMMRVQYPHPLIQYEGYSPLTAGRQYIDQVEMIDQSRFYAMKGAINPSAVLNFDGVESEQPLLEQEIERIKSDFEAAHQGPTNQGNLFVSAMGGRLDPWGAKPNEMDYTAGWSQEMDYILGGIFGITKPAAGMVEDASYATLFATLKQLHLLQLDPVCTMFGMGFTIWLAPFFGEDLFVEVRLPRIDDHDVMMAKVNALVGAQAITKGEMRRELDMPLFGDERDQETAGTPSMQEQMAQQELMMQQQQQMMQMQQPGQADESGMPQPPELGMEGEESELIEEEEVTRTRPGPGNMGRGALGPRKNLEIEALKKENRLLQNNRLKKLEEGQSQVLKQLKKLSKNGKH